MKFGYNTNGFAHHSLAEALRVIARAGYDGVAITLDVNHLNPFVCGEAKRRACAELLRELSLEAVVEGGSRFILDPFNKHEPSLISPEGRERRLAFLRECVLTAEALGARVVAFASGVQRAEVERERAEEWLARGIAELCDFAAGRGITLALEPEPGHFVETLADYERTKARCGRRDLRLTLDIGHIYCSEKSAPAETIEKYGDEIANVHIEDIKDGVHNHLPPGEGEVDFAAALASLRKIGYEGLVNLELSRSSHDAPRIAREALAFLKKYA